MIAMVERRASERLIRRGLTRQMMDDRQPMPLLEYLVSIGNLDEAASIGRLALKLELPAEEEAKVQALLRELEREPDWWRAALDTFVAAPSEEKWSAMFRFADEDDLYAWHRRAWRDLLARGVNANDLIRCASHTGIVNELIEVVESGAVDPQTLIERSRRAGSAESLWLGFAAQAAWARGDRFGTVSALRKAAASEEGIEGAFASLLWLQDHGDEELHAAIKPYVEAAGI